MCERRGPPEEQKAKRGDTPERLFSLVRLGTGGDWLLPDNNELTLWRLRIYGEEESTDPTITFRVPTKLGTRRSISRSR
jgi:hypothetical protein